MKNEEISEIHIYPLFKSWVVRLCLLFFPLLGFVWTAFGLFTFLPSFHNSLGDSLGTTLTGLICFVLMTLLYRALGRTRLVVTEDGIAYYTPGYRMYTPWKNIMRIETFRPYPSTLLHIRTLIGFKLRQQYVVGMKLAEGKARQVPVLETDWWNPVWSMAPFADRLPIVEIIVGRNWQEGAFGQDVRRYAPGSLSNSIMNRY